MLGPTRFLDFDVPAVAAFARSHAGAGTQRERAVRLYYAVRDGLRYDPYGVHLAPDRLTASRALADGSGWCVTKAVLLAACCRAEGIPARLGFADVKNHLATDKLREAMGTDLFYWHGYASLLLDGKWVKATPAFNLELCRKFGVLPLEFDGAHDSLFQPFDARQRRHMEYVRDRGLFDDLPFEELSGELKAAYPKLLEIAQAREQRSFESERPLNG
jgi:transglutaminase-like putative cysteine protease